MKERDARVVYADIIDLPHHQSKTHPHMSLYDRAAQFAPFAALTGYSDMVDEEARTTDSQIDLSDTEQDTINQKLSCITTALYEGNTPLLRITYFIPDERKTGGSYVTVTGKVKKIDPVMRKVVLTDKKMIDLDLISDIQGNLVNHLDEL